MSTSRPNRSSASTPVDAKFREFPLSQAAAALRHAEGGGLAGKVIIVPDAQEHSP